MFCPRCGNQPVVDRMRFCPSCGFRLDGVVDLLARDGAPGYPQMTPPQPEGSSPRKRGIRRGAKILFTSLGIFPLVLAFAIGVVDSPGPLVLPLTLFLIGALMMLYYRFFEEDRPAAPEAYRIPPPPQPVYLQPPQAPVYRPPVEPHPPQSVGEHTTRSLGQ